MLYQVCQPSSRCSRERQAANMVAAREPLFLPFRALGYITDRLPFAVQRLGRETFVTVSVGKAWQVRLLAELCAATQCLQQFAAKPSLCMSQAPLQFLCVWFGVWLHSC